MPALILKPACSSPPAEILQPLPKYRLAMKFRKECGNSKYSRTSSKHSCAKEGKAAAKSKKTAAARSCCELAALISPSISTTLCNMERPGKKPCWAPEIARARSGSTRIRTALAINLLSVLTMDKGLTSPGSQHRMPWISRPSFFGMKTIVASLNAVFPSVSTGKAAKRASRPCAAESSSAATCRTSTARCPRRRHAEYGIPSGPGDDEDDIRMA